MIEISYMQMVIAISVVWIMVRAICCVKMKRFDLKPEALLNLIGNTTMFIPLGIVWPAMGSMCW